MELKCGRCIGWVGKEMNARASHESSVSTALSALSDVNTH